MANVFEVKDLCIYLKEKNRRIPGVEHVSFTINKEETLGIIGESGSGKSLTCSAVLGLLNPKIWDVSGEVLLNGEPVPYWDNAAMSIFRGNRIALIMQNPMSAFNPMITIEKHFYETINKLGTNIQPKKTVDKIARDMLSRMRIRDPQAVLKSYAFQLSGGMLQRIMIALSLVMKPNILIADEPTTALDLTIQHEIIELLNELQKSTGTGILVVSHDLGVIAHLATHVAVMHSGSFVEKGCANAVLTAPSHPYTKGLFASKPGFSKKRLSVLQGQPLTLENRRSGCTFLQRCSFADDNCLKYDLAPFLVSPTHEMQCSKITEMEEKCNVAT
ncbi:MAG: ABC transporter ATP-binding protein [Clostridiales bacterium]